MGGFEAQRSRLAQFGLHERDLAREHRDGAVGLAVVGRSRDDIGDEENDEEVEQEVGATTDAEPVRDRRGELREGDGDNAAEQAQHPEDAADGEAASAAAREDDRDGRDGEGRDEYDLDDDLARVHVAALLKHEVGEDVHRVPQRLPLGAGVVGVDNVHRLFSVAQLVESDFVDDFGGVRHAVLVDRDG